ncbi:urease accessory protein UreE [Olivibacter sp. SDN3]|uniref:urease accessory protein UreE n=1 Tax=Olivibacter sp. SDN3 TaxID=2764720 RepID=UPI001651008D|nr:urease accessory protein UreE [Olivibacter sp. SDN3]QNL50878.1 urease accessory protein UreE [Olivibacter sp. SDN3]
MPTPEIKVEVICDASLNNEKDIDYLDIEWFEVNRKTIKRQSTGGLNFFIQKREKKPLFDGDILWADDNTAVLIRIKPCDCIVLTTADLTTVGLFCSAVGNQHLPLFLAGQQTLCLAYDGRLYQALLHQYGSAVSIESRQLLPQDMLQPYHK